MQVSKELQAQVETKLMDGLNRATKHFGRSFAFPSISYNLSGKTAGTATYQKNHIRLNATLLNENVEDFLARTVPHELAHLITWEMYKDDRTFRKWPSGRVSHHGFHWQSVCKVVGMDDVTRCHTYDVSTSGRKSDQYVWGCECGALMAVSRVKHSKMLGGRYSHKCGGRKRGELNFIVNAGRNTKSGAVQQVRDGLAQTTEVKPKPEPKKVKKPVGVRPGSSQSKLGQARLYAIANPGVDSRTLRTWVETNMGASAHSARGIWSKLKKEGLV